MPSAKQAMYACLAGDAGVTAVVGSKVYPDQAGEKAVEPYLVFVVDSDIKPATMRATVGIRRVTFKLEGYCATRAQSEQLHDALETLLHGKPRVTLGGLLVQSSRMNVDEGAVDEDDAPRPGEEFGLRKLAIDVVWWI